MVPDGPPAIAGTSPANAVFTRIFWTPAVLPPPLESCLGPATLRREGTLLGKGPCPMARPSLVTHPREVLLSRAHSFLEARRGEEILAFLRKQREERVAKELISHPHKAKIKTDQVR
ncbi:cilia- and flagella-associated protein HOATZ [Phalacrocorax aristotelis]|uniref:cilia- and flagella-associated protein HOATZ n=1 Tax=Phalacrocorax aristotelis TaxID=126867 RepID=UPI003F4BE7B5